MPSLKCHAVAMARARDQRVHERGDGASNLISTPSDNGEDGSHRIEYWYLCRNTSAVVWTLTHAVLLLAELLNDGCCVLQSNQLIACVVQVHADQSRLHAITTYRTLCQR